MNVDGRTTSEQLYIPTLLIVGGSQSLLLRCFHASKTMGLAIKACSPAEALALVPRRHPIAIVVPNDVFASTAYELAALARDVRSALLPVDPEVSVREIEAMIAAAIDGGLSQRERRGGAGRYSIVDGIEEEAPFSRRTLPPPSSRSPGVASTRPSMPPESVRVPLAPTSVRPSTAPAPTRPSLPPESVRVPLAPASVRPSTAPASTRPSLPPASTRPSVVSTSTRSSLAPVSCTVPPPPVTESVPPASGVQKAPGGAFAAIRSVFSSRR